MAISKSTPYVRYKENFTSNLHLGTIHVESEYLDRTQKTTIESIHGMTWHNKVVNENKELDLLSNLGFELTESKKEYFNVGEQRVSVDEIHGMQDIEPNEDGTYTYSVTSIEGEYAEIYDGLNHITSTSDGLDGNFEIVYDTDEEDITGSVVLDATMPNYTIEDSNIGELNDVVFKGETLVNILPQPSLRNEMENTSTQRLNEGHDEVVVADGEYKSAILKGQTLVNIVPSYVIDYTATGDWDGFYGLAQPSSQKGYSWKALQDIKPNTKYFISCNVETFDVDGNEYYLINNINDQTVFSDSLQVDGVGLYKWIATSKSELTDNIFIILRCQNAYARGTIKIKDFMIIEYQEGMENWDIPYFEGMQSVKMPVLTTYGKNLWYKGDLALTTGVLYLSESFKKGAYYFNGTVDTEYPQKTVMAFGNESTGSWYATIIGSNAPAILKEDCDLMAVYSNGWSFVESNGKPQTVTNITVSTTHLTTYEPYKSNILTSGKTFTQSMFEQGSFKESTPFDTKPYDDIKINLSENSTYYSNRIRTITTHKVIPGASYKVKINDGYGIFIGFCKNGLYSKLFSNSWSTYYNFTFTVPTDCDEIFFALRKIDNSDITVEDYPAIGLEIHQEVTLRAIGDVQDELNLLTGELTQRVGEVNVKDAPQIGTSVGNDTIRFGFKYSFAASNQIISNYPVKQNIDWQEENIGVENGINDVNIRIPKSELADESYASALKFIEDNNIKIYGIMKEPTTKTIDLTVTDQDNVVLETGKPRSYKDGHIQVQSNGILPSSISYEVPSQNHMHVDMLKPSNTYTLKRNGENFEGSFFIDGTEYNTNVFMTSHQLPNKSLFINDMSEHDKVAMFEGNYGTSSIPYFEGMASVEMPILTTTGKNLFDFANSGLREESAYDKSMSGYGFWSFSVQLQPNKDVTISRKNNDGYNLGLSLRVHNENTYTGGKWIIANHAQNENRSSATLTTNSDGYIWFTFSNNFDKINQILDICEYIQIEYGTVATAYEPFKSNTLTVNEPIQLRGIGDVKDEYNVETGELTQRIGEVVFDGSEDWTFYKTGTVNTISFSTILEKFDKAICDKFNYEISRGSANVKDEECYTYVNEGEKITKLYIYISKQKANDVESFKQYLQSNPITVQYQLAQPITRKVISTILDQDGRQIHSMHTYIGLTNMSTSSDTLIPNVNLNYEISSSTGTVTGTSATIENGENGSPISAIIYGESLVNVIQEPSDVEYVVLGEHNGNNITIENSVEGNIENAVVKGRTLINLAQPSLRAWTMNLNSDTASLKATTEEFIIDWSKDVPHNAWIQVGYDISPVFGGMLKADTDYTFIIRILENNPTFEGATVTGDIAGFQMWGLTGYESVRLMLQAGVTGTIALKYNFNKILTTQIIENLFGIAVEGTELDGTKTIDGGKLRISKDIIILEGDYTNNYQDIPYFEGMGSVEMPVLTTTGKNLIDVNHTLSLTREQNPTVNSQDVSRTEFTDVTLNSFTSTTASSGYWQYACYRISNAKPNTTYTLSYLKNIINPPEGGSSRNHRLIMFTSKKGSTTSSSSNERSAHKITTENDGVLFLCLADESQNGGGVGAKTQFSDIQLEENSVATSYEPHKSNTVTCNEEVMLRAIGDIKDELDLVTGKLTQRVEKIELDILSIIHTGKNLNGNDRFLLNLKNSISNYNKLLSNNTINNHCFTYSPTAGYNYGGNNSYYFYAHNQIYISFTSGVHTEETLRDLFNEKPFIIQLPAATNLIKTIDLTVTDQDGNPTSLHSYNNTTHIITNSQGLTANVEISNPSYDVVLKANTKYTLKLNRTNAPTNTPLEINLGGTEATMDSTVNSIAITTPSTLANNKLTIGGVGNKFKEAMVVEGDCVDRDLDYFEGIVGVENPVVEVCGKNIFDITRHDLDKDADGDYICTNYCLQGKPVRYALKKNTTYRVSYGEENKFNMCVNDEWVNTNNPKGVSFTTDDSGEYYIKIGSGTYNERIGKIKTDVQIEEGLSTTPYEPYQGNTLTTYPQITLHSIGNIKDELDLVNETVTRRIGEVVLDGSEDWRVESGGSSTHTRFSMRRGNNIAPISNITFEQYKCNRFRAVTAISGTVSEEVMLMENYDNYFISLVVKNTRLSTPNAEGLKTWLSQNPTTVIYLITPTTESVYITPPTPRTSTASVTLPTQLGESDYVTWNPYKEHYVHYNYEQDGSYTWDNLTDLNERQFIELYDRRTYVEQEYKNTFLSHDSKGTSKYVLIEPNQDYTVTVRFSELPQCETVKVNLGGSEVEMNVSDPHVHVTTPSTLSNYLCSISGKGLSGKITDILVIHCLEHEGFADIEYFEGIDSIGEIKAVDGVNKASIIVEQTNGNLIDIVPNIYNNGNNLNFRNIPVKYNHQYHISGELDLRGGNNFSVHFLKAPDGSSLSSQTVYDSAILNIPFDCKYISIYRQVSDKGHANVHHKIDLHYADMAKDEVRPRYYDKKEIILPMQLCRINTVYDNFYYDVIRGHYRIQQSIGHKYFTGADNENWTLIEKGQRILRFRYNNADIQIKSLGEYMTNRFTNGTATSPYESCAFNGSTFIISIDKERLSNATLVAFKEWLSSHNVHLYYQLASPMMIDLPQYSSKLELNTYKDEIYTFLKNCKPTVFTLDVPLDQTYRFYELQESQGYTNRIELTDERMTEEDTLYINTIYGSGISNLIEEPNNVNTLLKPNYEGRATSHTLTNGKVSTISVHGFEPNGVKVGTYNTVTKQYELTVKATSGENNNSVAFPIPYALEQYEDGTHDRVYYNSEYKQWMFEGKQTLTVAYNSSTGVFTNAIEIFRGMMPRSGMIGEFKVKFASGTTSARLYYSLDGSTYTYTTLRSMTDGVEYYIAFFNTGGTKIDMGTKIGADSEYTTLVPLSGTVSEALMINQIQSITECTYYLDKTYYYTEPTRPIELTVYEGTNTITENNGAIITIENNAHNKDALIYANTPYTVYWTYVGGQGNIRVTLGGVTQEVAATQGYVTITTSDTDLERGLLIGGFDVTIKDLMLVKGERIADLSYFEGSRAVGTAFIDEDGNTMYRITLVTGSELIQDKFEDVITFEDNKKHNVLVTKLLGTKPNKN